MMYDPERYQIAKEMRYERLRKEADVIRQRRMLKPAHSRLVARALSGLGDLLISLGKRLKEHGAISQAHNLIDSQQPG